jgi:hypothetical protein
MSAVTWPLPLIDLAPGAGQAVSAKRSKAAGSIAGGVAEVARGVDVAHTAPDAAPPVIFRHVTKN